MSWNETIRGSKAAALEEVSKRTNIPTNVQSMVAAAISASPDIPSRSEVHVTTHGHIDEAAYSVAIMVEAVGAQTGAGDDGA